MLVTRPAAVRAAVTPVSVAVVCVSVLVLLAGIGWGRRTRPWRRLVTPALTDVRLAGRSWPGVMGLSAVGLAGHLALFLVSARVAGSAAPVTRLLPLMVLALFAMGLPVNVGGWGPREGATAWAFGVAGLGAAQGVTVAVVYGVLTFVSGLPGAVVLARRPARASHPRPAAPARTGAGQQRTELDHAVSGVAERRGEGQPYVVRAGGPL